MIGRIAVAAAVFAIDTPFSYRIPAALQAQAVPGVRVTVPFGRGNRPTEGFLLTVEEGPEDKLKSVTQVLDAAPVLDEGMLRMAAFLRDRYFCTMYEAARVLLPAGLWYTQKRTYCLAESFDPALNPPEPGSGEAVLVERLQSAGGALDAQVLEAALGPEVSRALGRLLERGLVTVQTDVKTVPEKTRELACLCIPAEEALALAAKKRRSAAQQSAVLDYMARTGESCVKDIVYYTGAAASVVRRLASLGYLRLQQLEVFRQTQVTTGPPQDMPLNDAQQAAYESLAARMEQKVPGVALLYGVTGSGKTAVYLHLIRKTLAQGNSALLLVPEIALTPQLTRLFTSQLGDQVAVLHSSLGVAERYDQWRRIRKGDARVVIGARSAVFAPLVKPGLFIVDEEQEHSYKSETSPRYHAGEVAMYRGSREGALVVLGSATPSMESMYRAKTGVYGLCALTRRFNGGPLPQVTIADMKPDLIDGYGGSIGSVLRGELERNLQAGQQSILFLNRRGSSRLLMCTSCGYVPKCDRCSVSLTWHAANGRLMCHYCGHSEAVPDRCPDCGGRMRPIGSGTQKVQNELEALFPGVKVLRMDTDVITAVNTHDALLQRFEKEKIPILVGTQMVAKGLNLKNVTLVGVLDADMALYVDDFRAAENTFDLITQVVGRAGRGETLGRAVIQTMTPENQVLKLAAGQDYGGFYAMELAGRQGRSCPPFCDLLTLTFTALEEDRTLDAAWRFRQRLESTLEQALGEKTSVLGPAAAPVTRVNLYYRYRLVLAGHNSRPLRQLVSGLMRDFAKDKQNRGVSVMADVNAYE